MLEYPVRYTTHREAQNEITVMTAVITPSGVFITGPARRPLTLSGRNTAREAREQCRLCCETFERCNTQADTPPFQIEFAVLDLCTSKAMLVAHDATFQRIERRRA